MNPPEQAAPQPPTEAFPYWLRAVMGTPLVLLGGFVSTCYGLILCAYVIGRIGGERPVPNLLNLLVFWFIFGAAPLAAGILVLPTTPARKRFWWRALLAVFVLFLFV